MIERYEEYEEREDVRRAERRADQSAEDLKDAVERLAVRMDSAGGIFRDVSILMKNPKEFIQPRLDESVREVTNLFQREFLPALQRGAMPLLIAFAFGAVAGVSLTRRGYGKTGRLHPIEADEPIQDLNRPTQKKPKVSSAF